MELTAEEPKEFSPAMQRGMALRMTSAQFSEFGTHLAVTHPDKAKVLLDELLYWRDNERL